MLDGMPALRGDEGRKERSRSLAALGVTERKMKARKWPQESQKSTGVAVPHVGLWSYCSLGREKREWT